MSFLRKGIFALTICILASCRSTAESRYSLLHYDRTFLQKIIGAECHDATKGIAADVYRLGLSGEFLIPPSPLPLLSAGFT